jgi:hypothetical protein
MKVTSRLMRARFLVLFLVFAGTAGGQVMTPALTAQYVALADSASSARSDTARGRWQQRVTAAHDTLVATMKSLREQNDGPTALRFVLDLDRYWSNVAEQVSLYAQALAIPSATDPTDIRARALIAGARDAHRIKDQVKVRAWAGEAIRIYRQLGDSAGIGRGYLRLMYAALRDNDHSGLLALADTGEVYCRGRDKNCDAEFFNMQGESWRSRARYDSALAYYQHTVAIEGTPGLGHLGNLGFAYLGLGQNAAARTQFANGLRRAWSTGNRLYGAFFVSGLAGVAAADAPAEAARLFGVADAIYETLHASPDPADAIEFGRYRERAGAQLGTLAFDSLFAVGRRLPADSVVAAIVRAP